MQFEKRSEKLEIHDLSYEISIELPTNIDFTNYQERFMVKAAACDLHSGGHSAESARGVGAMEYDPESGESPGPANHRAAYIRFVEKKLIEKRTALDLVKRKVGRAVSSGRIARSDQLVNAERQADGCLSAVETWVIRLSADADSDWDHSRFKTDVALEDLSSSVKRMIARFT